LNPASDVLLTFKKECSGFDATCAAVRQIQLFAELISRQRLAPSKPLGKKVVNHNPCTPGRASGVDDEPREVLAVVSRPRAPRDPALRPRVQPVLRRRLERDTDRARRGRAAVGHPCLAGGGNRRRLPRRRVSVLPAVFEDSVKTMDLSLEVRDVAELPAEAL
jgi:hypothetical protein